MGYNTNATLTFGAVVGPAIFDHLNDDEKEELESKGEWPQRYLEIAERHGCKLVAEYAGHYYWEFDDAMLLIVTHEHVAQHRAYARPLEGITIDRPDSAIGKVIHDCALEFGIKSPSVGWILGANYG